MKNNINLFALVFVTILSACQVSLGDPVKVEKVLTISDTAKISIDMNIGDITIGVSTDDKAHITYYEYDRIKYEITENAGGFTLKQNIDKNSANGGNIKGVTILLPSSFKGTLSTKVNIGAINVSDISASSINLSSNTGHIFVRNISATTIIDLFAKAGHIYGTVKGSKTDFKTTSSTTIGGNSLTPNTGSGSKTLNVKANGIVDITFAP